MKPVTPVMPGSEPIEVVLGRDQPEYLPLPAIYLDTPERPMITRWELSDVERAKIAAGGDIVFQQLTFGHPFQPVAFEVCLRDEMPHLGEIE